MQRSRLRPLRRLRRALRAVVERCLGLSSLRAYHARIARRLRDPSDVDEFLAACLCELGVRPAAHPDETARIPTQGPLLIVANHPFGILDGLVLGALLRQRRPDLRILGNRWLHRMPQLRGLVLDVDPLGGDGAARSNTAPLRAAHRWLDDGRSLMVFPAGKVSARRWGRRGVHDDTWSAHIARLQQRSGATVLPVHIAGRNSWFFQLVGLLHPRLRTLLLARETLRKRGATIAVRIGNPIRPKQMERFADARELVDYLRLRTEILARRQGAVPAPVRRISRSPVPLVPPIPREELATDVASLPECQRLVVSGELETWCAWAPQAPSVLREIGRLREQTFRGVGEGTGRAIDLDRFDPHYLHLFAWHRTRREVVGAYRLGHVDRILVGNDQRGFYTNTLYDFDERFLSHVRPGLELGRSFVAEAYQREFLPLLMLWRGIATYVARNPRYSMLFGAVSISDRHHDVSKHLMLDHLQRYRDAALSDLVTPRHPVPAAGTEMLPLRWTQAMVSDLGDVSAMVAEIEPEQRGIPVLLREYLKLGGRLVGLNVDPAFQRSITALVVIDMSKTDRRVLGRYMGRGEADAFLQWHARTDHANTLDCA